MRLVVVLAILVGLVRCQGEGEAAADVVDAVVDGMEDVEADSDMEESTDMEAENSMGEGSEPANSTTSEGDSNPTVMRSEAFRMRSRVAEFSGLSFSFDLLSDSSVVLHCSVHVDYDRAEYDSAPYLYLFRDAAACDALANDADETYEASKLVTLDQQDEDRDVSFSSEELDFGVVESGCLAVMAKKQPAEGSDASSESPSSSDAAADPSSSDASPPGSSPVAAAASDASSGASDSSSDVSPADADAPDGSDTSRSSVEPLRNTAELPTRLRQPKVLKADQLGRTFSPFSTVGFAILSTGSKVITFAPASSGAFVGSPVVVNLGSSSSSSSTDPFSTLPNLQLLGVTAGVINAVSAVLVLAYVVAFFFPLLGVAIQRRVSDTVGDFSVVGRMTRTLRRKVDEAWGGAADAIARFGRKRRRSQRVFAGSHGTSDARRRRDAEDDFWQTQ